MRKWLVRSLACIAMLLVHGEGQGQDSTVRDSLEKALASATTDTARINLMNQLANAWKHTDLQRTLELAGEALDLARKVNFASGEARAMNMLGLAAYRMSEHALAIERLRSAKEMAETIQDSTTLMMAIGNLGLVHSRLGDFPTALQYYHRQLAMVQAKGDSLNIYRILNNMGLLHHRANNEELAIGYLRQALDIAERRKDEANMASVLHNQATRLNENGSPDTARVLFERALTLNKATGNDRFQATNHMALAMWFLEAGDVDRPWQPVQPRTTIGTGTSASRIVPCGACSGS